VNRIVAALLAVSVATPMRTTLAASVDSGIDVNSAQAQIVWVPRLAKFVTVVGRFLLEYAAGKLIDYGYAKAVDEAGQQVALIRREVDIALKQTPALAAASSLLGDLQRALDGLQAASISRDEAVTLEARIRQQGDQLQDVLSRSAETRRVLEDLLRRHDALEERVRRLEEQLAELQNQRRSKAPKFLFSVSAAHTKWFYNNPGVVSLSGDAPPVGFRAALTPTTHWGPEVAIYRAAPTLIRLEGETLDAQIENSDIYLGWSQQLGKSGVWGRLGVEIREDKVSYPSSASGVRDIDVDHAALISAGLGFAGWQKNGRVGGGISGDIRWTRLSDPPEIEVPASVLSADALTMTVYRGEGWAAFGGPNNRFGLVSGAFLELERINADGTFFRRRVNLHREDTMTFGAWIGVFVSF